MSDAEESHRRILPTVITAMLARRAFKRWVGQGPGTILTVARQQDNPL